MVRRVGGSMVSSSGGVLRGSVTQAAGPQAIGMHTDML